MRATRSSPSCASCSASALQGPSSQPRPSKAAACAPLTGFHTIGTAIDGLLRAVAEDGAADYRRTVEHDVFEFSRRQSLRSRSWFRETGFDPAPAEVPDYADLITAGL